MLRCTTKTTPNTTLYTPTLHDALPIYAARTVEGDEDDLHGQAALGANPDAHAEPCRAGAVREAHAPHERVRSEEHTSELQSPSNLVCRLLLEKKKITRCSA